MNVVRGEFFRMSIRLPQGLGLDLFGFYVMYRPPLDPLLVVLKIAG